MASGPERPQSRSQLGELLLVGGLGAFVLTPVLYRIRTAGYEHRKQHASGRRGGCSCRCSSRSSARCSCSRRRRSICAARCCRAASCDGCASVVEHGVAGRPGIGAATVEPMTATQAPPRWDLDPIFAGLEDRGFNSALEGVYARVDRLVALYDDLDIRAREPRPVDDADVTALESVLEATNELQSELRPIATYLYALVSTDSRNDVAASRHVELQTRAAPLAPLGKRLGAWLASLDVDTLIARSPAAAEHEFALRKAAENAELQMSEHEESLAGELAPSGSLAWQRLHGEISSQLTVVLDLDGKQEQRADGAGARPRDASGCGAPARRVRRRARRVVDGCRPARGRAQRRQGRARRAEPAARLRRRSRARVARQQRRSGDARRDDRRGGGIVARTSAATSAPRRRCSATAAVCRGGICSLPSAGPARSSGRARPRRCKKRSPASRRISRAREPRVRGAVGRRGDARRQAGRRVLRGRDRRRQPHHDELRRQSGLRLDARARARARVPQRDARRADAAATPAADGAGRDRVDLLRDVAVRARGRARRRRRRAARAPRRAPRGRDADGRRHPQPLPVRDRALRAAAPDDACRWPT